MILVVTHERCGQHESGAGHPERPARLTAALAGLPLADLDTATNAHSYDAATATTSMGFCLFNSIAITAAALVGAGERVAIVDYDAHHGNGTQDVFYETDRVLFVSLHQYPRYPGTGAITETGRGDGTGFTVNVPFPAGTSGDAYRAAFDEIVVPKIEQFAPTWMLVSAGFDGHRLDPLSQLGLSAGDYGDLAARLARLVAPGRLLAFLEGGYHLDALAASVAATVGASAHAPVELESRSSGPHAEHVVTAVRAQHGFR